MEKLFEKYFRGDRIIWAVILMLSLFSVLAVYSATGTLAFTSQNGNTLDFILKHVFILSLGIVIVYMTHLVHYKYFSRLAQFLLLISIPLLILTLAMGTSINDAKRWLDIPVIGLSFQTSDLAKLALVMYLARLLSHKQENIKDLKGAFIPIILPVLVICGLIIPADFSTGAILMFTSMVLMFIGRVSFKHMALLGFIGGLCLSAYVLITLSGDNDENRIETWKSRIESYASGDEQGNYQANQAKIAIAKGGLIRMRPGKSTQRNFLPAAFSDFIYAIIIEEYGFLGGAFVMFLYLFLLYRAGIIIKKCNRTFPAFLVMGLTIMIVIQALVNMAVAVNLFPVTGQTLPLVSMGGTSLLFTSIALGIILSVSRSNDLETAKQMVDNDAEK